MEIYENLSLEDMEGEVWKDIKGYEGLYQVSNMGRIKALNYAKTKQSKILKPFNGGNGYLKISLYGKVNKKNTTVHRVVAETFIPNPQNKPTVDHISTIKTDNRACNLKWATRSEQLNDNIITKAKMGKSSSRVGKMVCRFMHEANKKKVKCITTNETFNSIREAAQHYGIAHTNISNCCNGKRNYCGKLPNGTKLKWEYID